MIYKSN